MTTNKTLLTTPPPLGKQNSLLGTNIKANNALANYEHQSVTDIPYRVIELIGNTALLFNERATLSIFRRSTSASTTIQVGQLVSVKYNNMTHAHNGHITSIELMKHQCPDANINLFELVPHSWVKNRDLIKRAADLLQQLSAPHRLLFNAIFWDANRFQRFCRQPSSMIGHHSEPNGNLRHTIEVAEEMQRSCNTCSYANFDLGVLAALLHDCGKADEYMPNSKGGWDLSDRGKLLGHKVSAVEWIISAVTRWNIRLPADHYEALLHIMTAIPHAPEWMGIRAPVIQESFLLSMADRLSGHDDLMAQTVNPNGGFGRYHKHLQHSPFTVRG